MKTAFRLCCFCLLFGSGAFAQSKRTGADTAMLPGGFYSLLKQNIIPVPVHLVHGTQLPPGKSLPVSVLKTPKSLAGYLGTDKPRSVKKIFPGKTLSNPPSCQDSSDKTLIGVENQIVYVTTITHGADDATLVAGVLSDTTVAHVEWVFNAFLMKVDNGGNVLWFKMIGDADKNTYSDVEINHISVLDGGDIMVSGISSINTKCTLLARFDASGNLIWYKTYQSSLIQFINFVPIDFRSIRDGLNGDLIVCGSTMRDYGGTQYATTVRMDGNGNIIWDVSYSQSAAYGSICEGLGAKMVGGNILSVMINHGVYYVTDAPGATEFMTLDYSTGNLLSRRLFSTNYSSQPDRSGKQFAYYNNHIAFLQNGHTIVSGNLTYDLSHSFPVNDHFGVLEFDATENLVDAYSIASGLPNNSSASNLQFDPQGRGIFMLGNYSNNAVNSWEGYLGLIQDHRFIKQLHQSYPTGLISAQGSFGENRLASYLNDGGFQLIHTYLSPVGSLGSYIERKKMHLSDTSSVCLGINTAFAQFVPLSIVERDLYPRYVDEVHKGTIAPTAHHLKILTPPAVNPDLQCQQTNYCDTLKIHGDSIFCGTVGPQTFTAFKNAACGAVVQWQLDSAYIVSDSVLSDSSIQVTFKNNTGFVKIGASLPSGTCIMAPKDSLVVHIISSPKPVSLGADTVLCSGNIITLHAGPGYASYLWQNGSTDSLFSVMASGEYRVQATDYCGSVFKDTVEVTDAYFPFSAGNDTVKCNSDTVILNATPGFINYSWSPAYNLVVTPGSSRALAFPESETTYIVKAEKWTGCFVTASVKIGTLTSPSINLGQDTSICQYDELLIDAGPGFNAYSWSNGSTEESITVTQDGLYNVKATAANGCVSKATRSLHVYPIHVVFLANKQDTTLCEGTALNYNFSFPGANFTWSDGNTSGVRSITTPGHYNLQIDQYGCGSATSVDVFFTTPPVFDLGADNMICAGNTKILDATTTGATYRWQDGSTGPQYLVSRPGVYSVAVTSNGCAAAGTINIQYIDKPQFTFPKDTTVCQGQSLVLNPKLKSKAVYDWQDGSTDSVYIVRSAGLYSVTATNKCGSASSSIQVDPGVCELFLPNAFTPNRDGKNDIFRVTRVFNVQSFRLQVVNRWGQSVFETSDISKGWDGTFASIDQPQGGYTWTVNVVKMSGERTFLSGVVMLIR